MDNQEQKLINEIRNLFKELIKEQNRRLDKTAMHIIFPQNNVYVSIANELYKKALELEKVNSKYSTDKLKNVMDDDLYMVEQHKYEYEKNSNKPKEKSVKELEKYMHKATNHIRLYSYKVLGDI